MTEFEAALDEALGALEQLKPGTVQLSTAPEVDVAANVGEFRRQRTMERTAYQWIEFGTIQIRRSALYAAGVTTEPAADQEITAHGTTYRIKFVKPDNVSFVLDCVNLY